MAGGSGQRAYTHAYKRLFLRHLVWHCTESAALGERQAPEGPSPAAPEAPHRRPQTSVPCPNSRCASLFAVIKTRPLLVCVTPRTPLPTTPGNRPLPSVYTPRPRPPERCAHRRPLFPAALPRPSDVVGDQGGPPQSQSRGGGSKQIPILTPGTDPRGVNPVDGTESHPEKKKKKKKKKKKGPAAPADTWSDSRRPFWLHALSGGAWRDTDPLCSDVCDITAASCQLTLRHLS
ncbi:unnamed protein product [Arctogadus glacialis]